MKNRIILILLLMVAAATTTNAAIVTIKIDKNANAALVANYAQVDANNQLIESETDSIKKTEVVTAELTGAMWLMKQAYVAAMTNIKGFGVESAFYRRMASLVLSIVNNAPKAVQEVLASQLPGKITTVFELTKLTTTAYGLVMDFNNIVNNGKVDFKNIQAGSAVGDGYNFMTRKDRLKVATMIISRLETINRQLGKMISCTRWMNMKDVIGRIDSKTLSTMLTMNYYLNDWKREWNKFASKK